MTLWSTGIRGSVKWSPQEKKEKKQIEKWWSLEIGNGFGLKWFGRNEME